MMISFANKAWILDSGASDRITPDLSLLHDVKKVQTACYITIPNGKQALIKHVGSLTLAHGLTLDYVLHVPEFQFNLLSISRLTTQFVANVIFTPYNCLLQGLTSQTITLGKQNKGLYFLQLGAEASFSSLQNNSSSQDQKVQSVQAKHVAVTCFSDAELWHFRLGHFSFE